ncbi:hypothetical protein [Spirosoma luteum]|uniref:hypothetical protein n=1 Tax=Spirosoma luteum TaxID=431553 RepID=UPI00039F4F82|nr:hypothetical protein [Spirosoma luteum]
MKTLHVLNGDATAHAFVGAGLPGDVAIWREMLSEGPLLVAPRTDDELWTLRRNWLTTAFGTKFQGEQPDYTIYVVREFEKICRYTDYDEVVFWFEHDLFCQINLVFLLACFDRVDLGQTVLRQVSVDRIEGVADFKGYGQLTGTQLAALYPQAETLTTHELMLATRVWSAYAASDKAALTALLTTNVGRLCHLPAALTAHLARLTVASNGLSLIQQQLLRLIQASPKTPRQVVSEWLSHDRIYGLGDWSLENYLTELAEQGIIEERDGLLVSTATQQA